MSESRREYRDASGKGGVARALKRPSALRGRDFLGIVDLQTEELSFLIDLATEVKAHPGSYWTALEHRSLALLFEKPSLRTRATFEIGAKQLGMARAPPRPAGKSASASGRAPPTWRETWIVG